MAATSASLPVLITVLLVLAVLLAACVSFGFIQTLLFVAFAAVAAMFCGFIIVASSRDAY